MTSFQKVKNSLNYTCAVFRERATYLSILLLFKLSDIVRIDSIFIKFLFFTNYHAIKLWWNCKNESNCKIRIPYCPSMGRKSFLVYCQRRERKGKREEAKTFSNNWRTDRSLVRKSDDRGARVDRESTAMIAKFRSAIFPAQTSVSPVRIIAKT